MKVKIYGKTVGCKFCDTAKQICQANSFDMEFVDIEEAGLSVVELSEICGQPVRQVPQIFVDDAYIGGCDKFIEFLRNQ